MPEERPQRNAGDRHGDRTWTRNARGIARNPGNRNLPVQNAQYRGVSSLQLSPQRQSARSAQRPPRDREDQQTTQNRLAGLPRGKESVEVDRETQRQRSAQTRTGEKSRTVTGRQRQAHRNAEARRQAAASLDTQLADLVMRTGGTSPDRSALTRSEGDALAAKQRAARDHMREGRSGHVSARDIRRGGRTHGRGPRDGRPGNRTEGRDRDRGDRSRSSPALGKG
jgi:hypothetical protein